MINRTKIREYLRKAKVVITEPKFNYVELTAIVILANVITSLIK
jgi:hypothetical protein